MKVLIKLLILLDLVTPNLSLAMENDSSDEIELSAIRVTKKFVGDNGKIINEYRNDFISKTGVNGNIELWSTFKESLDSSHKRGIAGEVAAKFFFEILGYQVLESHYKARIDLLNADLSNGNGIFKDEQCTTRTLDLVIVSELFCIYCHESRCFL